MVSLVNSHTNATRIGWHLWELDLRFSSGLPPGWVGMRTCTSQQGLLLGHPGGNPGANQKSISHRCHPILVAFVWELTKETIDLPLGEQQVCGGKVPRRAA